MAATTGTDAVRQALSFIAEVNDAPAAAWYGGDDVDRLWFVAARGLHHARVESLRCALPMLTRWRGASGSERRRILSSFRMEAGIRSAVAVDAGDAVLLIEAGPEDDALQVVGSLLESALGQHRERDLARLRNERLDAGVAVAAHELRRPLLGAKAAVECLLAEDVDRDRSMKLLRRSHRELEELSRTLDALAHWSVQGKTELDLRPMDLPDLVKAAVASCAEEPGSARVVVTDPGEIAVLADPAHLRPALANVVHRAVHHSPRGEDVTIRVSATRSEATVTVVDRGPAIPVAEQLALFDPFAGAEAGPRRTSALDLFISKRVIEAHGGRIWANGGADGTTFHIVFPVVARGGLSAIG